MSLIFTHRRSRLTLITLTFFILTILSSGSLFETVGQSKQLSLADIIIALRSKKAEAPEKNKILSEAVKARGITFSLTPEIEKELRGTGAYPELLSAIREKAPVIKEPVEKKPDAEQVAAVMPKPSPAPPNFDFYWGRASSAIKMGDIDAALPDLHRAIELRPGDAPSRLARGNALLKQEKYEAAIIDLDSSIKIEPNAPAYLGRAMANEKLGRVDAAIADYQNAAELDPQNEAAKSSFSRLVAEKEKALVKPYVEPEKTTPVTQQDTGPVQIGALNVFASRLATPVYSESDRRLGFQGKVTVQILLDETGKVISAEAKTGPKNLRGLAEDAVKRSRFNPILVEGRPVKAEGSITYNFIAK